MVYACHAPISVPGGLPVACPRATIACPRATIACPRATIACPRSTIASLRANITCLCATNAYLRAHASHASPFLTACALLQMADCSSGSIQAMEQGLATVLGLDASKVAVSCR